MARKDYYVILGITPEESQAGVKSAFRDLAMRYHPDRAGPQGTHRFQEISEAYNTLGNRERRANYDDNRRRYEDEPPVSPARHGPRPGVEPLDPGPATPHRERRRPSLRDRLSILEDFIAPYRVRDEILDRLRRSFTDEWLPKSGRLDALNLGIHMSREEALRGADVRLGVPVFDSCPNCHGVGRIGLYPCTRCHETGMLLGEEDVLLRIPPMVSDGTVYRIPLQRLGIHDLYLTVLIRIDN